MEKTILNKLVLSRSLYFLAKEHLTATSGSKLLIACNLLQDSIESFMIALADSVNANVNNNTNFDKYFDLINSRISPKELPYRSRLIALNKLRVSSKHYGIEPSKQELEQFALTVGSFLEEVSKNILSKDFATISLADMLTNGETKELLQNAEKAYEIADYSNCLIYCRQALFIKFESGFDAKPYLTSGTTSLGLLSLGSKVPYYARNKEYLDNNVKSPTDYVIYDHNSIEMELMKSGIDSLSYWNVYRLTPEVYRSGVNEPWIIKREFRILDGDDLKDRAEYVLSTTTDILLKKDQSSQRTKSPDYQRYYFVPKDDFINVYEKASHASKSQKVHLNGVKKVFSDFYIDSLDNSGIFWHVSHWNDEIKVYGFVHEKEIEFKTKT